MHKFLKFISAIKLYMFRAVPLSTSGVPRGGSGVETPPRNSEGPPKNRVKRNLTVKTVKKNAELRTPTPQDVRKKRQ